MDKDKADANFKAFWILLGSIIVILTVVGIAIG